MARDRASWIRLAVRGLGGALVAFLVFGAVIHLPALRPTLVRVGLFKPKAGASCPFGYSASTSVAELKAREVRSHAARRGTVPAKAAFALGFRLDADRMADLQAWAAREGIACTSKHGGQLFSCDDVHAGNLQTGNIPLAVKSIWFELGSQGTLASIKVLRQNVAAEPVAAAFDTAEKLVTGSAGKPTQVTGSSAPEALQAGALTQAAAVYQYANYYAALRATNMGNGRYVLTEEYSSLVDS